MAKDHITKEEVDYLMSTAITDEAIVGKKTLVVAYDFEVLGNWTIRGEGSVVNPNNFDIDKGRARAREKASDELWERLGFLKQLQLAGKVTLCKELEDIIG